MVASPARAFVSATWTGWLNAKGRFFVIEAKGPGKGIPRGQQILFAALVGKGFTVLVLWGKPNEPRPCRFGIRTAKIRSRQFPRLSKTSLIL